MINVNGLKRNAKNIVKKYSDAQVKVREATSNDPWGPSSTIMAEIADLTYNVVAFSEIMQMIWKRLNDHGKNWRHVYKALVVLEYLIKTGTEKVAHQCIENIFAIQTLKDFQYMEENKDYGMNIREKSKKLVALLKDTEKLKAERSRALKAKSRLAESMSSVGKSSLGSMMSSSGSSGSGDTTNINSNSTNNGNSYLNYQNDSGSSSSGMAVHMGQEVGPLSSDIDSARPQTASEEENQLKLALALSKEEAEQQEKTRKNDELRLKLALDVSKKSTNNGTSLLDEFSGPSTSNTSSQNVPDVSAPGPSKNIMDDLIGLSIPEPSEPPKPAPPAPVFTSTIPAINSLAQSHIPEPQNDPWSVDPWQAITQPTPASTTSMAPMQLNNLLSNTSILTAMPTVSSSSTTTSAVPLSTTATTIPSTNDNFNHFKSKKLMSKNPFED